MARVARLTLGQLGRAEEALGAYAEVVSRYKESPSSELQVQVAGALVTRGTLGQLGRAEEALGAYTEVVSRYGASPSSELQEGVARALVNRGVTPGALHQQARQPKRMYHVHGCRPRLESSAMPILPGALLGPYRIDSLLGAGGMGEVYKARDTRLERTVAIKVLPEAVASDPDLRQRFEREARAVAALNHPNICTLHDIGNQDGVDFLVMEYLDGETLAQRLARGVLPLEQALHIAVEIADAIEKAHRQGIVHRDLKPGNIMLTQGGAKLLDFGLARLTRAAHTGEDEAETLAGDLTGGQMVLGTVPYMAPEQIEGKPADARTDVFALGIVIYEAVTGRRAFAADSRVRLMSAILEVTPPAISSISTTAPLALDRVVAKCLAKLPADRWASAGDLADALRWLAQDLRAVPVAPPAAARSRREPVLWGLAATLAAALLVLALFTLTRPADEARTVRFALDVEGAGSHFSLSPDGRYLAYAADQDGAGRRLWVRPLDTLTAHPLPGTAGATYPFWSPDSQYLAYFSESDRQLKKIPMAGGAPQVICAIGFAHRGGSWGSAGVILFASDMQGERIYRVSDRGGIPTPVTAHTNAAAQYVHSWPQFLPDGRHFLYHGGGTHTNEANGVYVAQLDSPEPTRIVSTNFMARYAEPGRLLFVQGESLVSQPFDPDALEITGEPVVVVEDIAVSQLYYLAGFSVSANGVLAYRSGGDFNESQLTWFDRDGARLGVVGAPGAWETPELSPDGTKIVAADGDGLDLWIFDLDRQQSYRFTFQDGPEGSPTWSPDGADIAYMAAKNGGPFDLYRRPANGTGAEELLLASENHKVIEDWSPDGRYLAYFDVNVDTAFDLWVLPLFGDRTPIPLLQTPARESHAEFSPDGRWIAYTSNESGRAEIYVQPFPPTGGKWQISSDSGRQPKWRRDGAELFFLSEAKQVMAVDVKPGATFEAGTPRALFAVDVNLSFQRNNYDVTADGQRFLVNLLTTGAAPVTIVLNWSRDR
jgi:eukaryotic-like serine/threonine-protein kinase